MKSKEINATKILFGAVIFAGAFFIIRKVIENFNAFDPTKNINLPKAPASTYTPPASTYTPPASTYTPPATTPKPVLTFPAKLATKGRTLKSGESMPIYTLPDSKHQYGIIAKDVLMGVVEEINGNWVKMLTDNYSYYLIGNNQVKYA